MQSTQAFLEQPLDRRLNLSPHSLINKEFIGMRKPKVMIPFSKEKPSPIPPQKRLQSQKLSLEAEHIKATNYLSTIIDPLWKHVCRDVLSMMGAASFLRIWDSTLGEACSQNQSIEIYCKTKEIAQFIQQYDFVILGSLQPYFPALKQLKVTVVQDLPCH